MTEYEVIYLVKINAKDKKDMEHKANEIGEKFSKTLHKKVCAIGYKNLEEHQQTLI